MTRMHFPMKPKNLWFLSTVAVRYIFTVDQTLYMYVLSSSFTAENIYILAHSGVGVFYPYCVEEWRHVLLSRSNKFAYFIANIC